jgi:hypothetical protein
MSVPVSSAFVLSCVGSGLVTGLITRPKAALRLSITSIARYQNNCDVNRPEGLIRKLEEKEDLWSIGHESHSRIFTIPLRK